MTDLTDMEMDVLRICNGEDMPGWAWGAAMSEVVGSLRGGGFVELVTVGDGLAYIPTEKGFRALQEADNVK